MFNKLHRKVSPFSEALLNFLITGLKCAFWGMAGGGIGLVAALFLTTGGSTYLGIDHGQIIFFIGILIGIAYPLVKIRFSDTKVINRSLSRKDSKPGNLEPKDLKKVWNNYCDQWPDINDQYDTWKPASALPAPKWVIKRAMKLCYAEWPEPIDFQVYNSFFMEFVDLAMHLPPEKYDLIEKFRNSQIEQRGGNRVHDPLLMHYISSGLASVMPAEMHIDNIISIRDGLKRSKAWDPVGADDNELDMVRNIILESTVEFSALTSEWRFYITSINRDKHL